MARGFNDVNKGVQRSRIGKMIDASLDVVKQERRWPKKKLSPSMFPICSIQEYAKQRFQNIRGYISGQSGAMLSIFAGSGTNMHSTVQDALGNSGQLVGHWDCSNRDCKEHAKTKSVYENGKKVKAGKHTRYRSTDNMCPTCGKPMAYAELKILFKGLKGYVDGLIDNLDGTYSLLDLKSTTVAKAESGAFFVTYHQLQIMTYAYVLRKRYGYKIVDYTLVYVPRDNPKKFVERTFIFDAAESKRAYTFMMTQINAWSAVMLSVKEDDAKHAIEHKPCKSEKFYWDEFHGYDVCPFVDVCFLESHLYSKLKELDERIKANPEWTYAEIVKPTREKKPQGLFNKGPRQTRGPKRTQI